MIDNLLTRRGVIYRCLELFCRHDATCF
jgi:hypothetical protein